MGGTGIDGGLDGGTPGSGVTVPSGPFTLRPAPPDTLFAGLVAQMDASVQSILGDGVITYQPLNGSPVPVPGVFDAAFLLAIAGGEDGAGVETVTPAVWLQIANLPADPLTDTPTITVGGLVYRVWKRIPDDFGSIVLALSQVR